MLKLSYKRLISCKTTTNFFYYLLPVSFQGLHTKSLNLCHDKCIQIVQIYLEFRIYSVKLEFKAGL